MASRRETPNRGAAARAANRAITRRVLDLDAAAVARRLGALSDDAHRRVCARLPPLIVEGA